MSQKEFISLVESAKTSHLLPEQAHHEIFDKPIKNEGQPEIGHALLEAHALAVINNLRSIEDYFSLSGSCSDERLRVSLLNGEPIEPRLSIFGGPTIYATAILELSGQSIKGSDVERVAAADKLLLASGFKRGAHISCAACNFIHIWMGNIHKDPERYLDYTKAQLGPKFDLWAAKEVVGYASDVFISQTYKDFNESKLKAIYGEEAGSAFEIVEETEHEGSTVVRIKRPKTIANFNAIYNQSVVGKGSFIFNDGYADAIEHALSSNPDAINKKKLAEHAREMILLSIIDAVPNKQIYQINIS